ncbi:MAG: hypothetical protein NVSMB6_28760 [Burkholderiaceae bacterium]
MPSKRDLGSLVKVAELAMAAPQVIAMRTAPLLACGPFPRATTQAEVARMSVEKFQALAESMSAMSAQLFVSNQKWASLAVQQWWNVWLTPWSVPNWGGPALGFFTAISKHAESAITNVIAAGIAPVHQRVIGNVRRLSQVKSK